MAGGSDLERALAGLMRSPRSGGVEASIRAQVAMWTLFDGETARLASVAERLTPKKAGEATFSAEAAIAAVEAASRQYFGRGVVERESLGAQRDVVFRNQVEALNRFLAVMLDGDGAERVKTLDAAVDLLGLRDARARPNVSISGVWWSAGFIAPVAIACAAFFSRQLSPDDEAILAPVIVRDPNSFFGFHLDGCSLLKHDAFSAAETARLARYVVVSATWGLYLSPELFLIGLRICRDCCATAP